MKVCKLCKKLLTKKQKGNKFCSRSCAATLNNVRKHTDASREKASASLKRYHSKIALDSKVETTRSTSKCAQHCRRKKLELLDTSKRTVQKILSRMKVACFKCGWNVGTCDVHHVVPKKCGGSDSCSNLVVLCPNCHRLVHSNKLSIEGIPSIQDAYGDSWLDFYYG